ncbi:MAG: hypothetical protein REI94_03530 [Moraxellaceae bacterium]|nr:hypothetical protein [Moraxellaceae bacterium]
MHLLLGLLIVGLLGFLIYRALGSAGGQGLVAQESAEAASLAARLDVAFVADGKLFFRSAGSDVQQIHSAHAEEAMDRVERSRQRNDWKQNTSFGITAGGGMRNFGAADTPVAIVSALFDTQRRQLLYSQWDQTVGGLFACTPNVPGEQRILLKQQLHLDNLALSPDGERLCAASYKTDGVANIVLMKRDGSELREVTGGDTVDTAPAWIPGAEHKLLFQSAGLARTSGGHVVAQGHASIQMLDMQSGTISPVLENPAFDFLRPRVSPDGNLLYIRRPYEQPRYEAGNMLLDTLLLPFRLARAVFHYLNFFSLMYSRKPLTSASGPEVRADIKNIVLQGRRIDAEEALRKAHSVHGVPSLVPASWELVSRTRDGADTVLAQGVASYDIDAQGRVIYSNGRGVFALGGAGRSALVFKSDLIADVQLA